ncbi:MAG: hypothetical protein HFI50_06195 [Lachnospiraceae bacterium]|jgi:hypothetical protein|nr:hypothetical protein [Lachnospiraceae bacterium]
MVINGMNGAGGVGMPTGAVGGSQAEDAVSKRLQQQIENAQKKLQEISGNSEMSTEEKMKMRQEIQKEIADLNSQLRQHQMEMRKKEMEETKKKQAENASAAEQNNRSKTGNAKNDSVDVQISAEGMQAMISADGAMKQAKVQGGVATSMEGKANVLEVEIQLDSARNGDTSLKEAQLADMRQKAQEATASQMGTLAEAREHLSEANASANTAGTKQDDVKAAEEEKEKDEEGKAASVSENKDEGSDEGNAAPGVSYAPVDVLV